VAFEFNSLLVNCCNLIIIISYKRLPFDLCNAYHI